MFASTPKTNAKTQYKTDNTYSTTFSGPVTKDESLFTRGRNEAMAQAEFQGNERAFNQQAGKGIGAGGAMQAYRAGVMADAEAAKGYGQAQQELLNQLTDAPAANLQFQERVSGERAWLQDLLLDRDEAMLRERMDAYKTMKDVNLGDYRRKINEAIAAERRKTETSGSLF